VFKKGCHELIKEYRRQLVGDTTGTGTRFSRMQENKAKGRCDRCSGLLVPTGVAVENIHLEFASRKDLNCTTEEVFVAVMRWTPHVKS
jgi:hypothetical protein